MERQHLTAAIRERNDYIVGMKAAGFTAKEIAKTCSDMASTKNERWKVTPRNVYAIIMRNSQRKRRRCQHCGRLINPLKRR